VRTPPPTDADPLQGVAGPRWIEPEWPAPAGVRALATTRAGGHSRGPRAGLNLGLGCGDDPARVLANRALLERSLGLPRPPLWLHQVHGARVVQAESGVAGAARADGCVAARPGLVCAVLSADCLPVLLCARDGSRVGAVHAGWRGLAAGVLEAAIAAIALPPARLLAWIGPAIGAEAYRVGPEVRAALLRGHPECAAAFRPAGARRWHCDLVRAARLRLAGAGLTAVFGGHWCTASDPARFYSHRRDPRSGRSAALIWRLETPATLGK